MSEPRRIDPPSCGCDECWTDVSVPLNRATWQQVKAMLAGEIEDATGTELVVEVRVWEKAQATLPDGQQWAWKYDPPAIARDRGLASCGHPADADGECSCSYWPERAPDA